MNYYAHTRADGEKQLLKDHLKRTAELARDFSLPAFCHSAYLAGLLHDLGKISAVKTGNRAKEKRREE